MSEPICGCFVELLEEARVNALNHALMIIEGAARLGGDEHERAHRCVMLGGALALTDLVVADHFPPEEVKALMPHLAAMRKTLDQLRILEHAKTDRH